MTQLGLVRYLVKYVSKIEPTFQLGVKESQAEVDRYFSTRLIAAPEVVTTLLSYLIAGGTQRIIFLDTSKVPKSRQSRVLTDRSGRSIAPRDKEVIPRWRFLTPLSGAEPEVANT